VIDPVPPADDGLPHPREASTQPNRRRWWIHLFLIGAYPLVIGLVGLRRIDTQEPALSHDTHGLLVTCAVELLFFAIVLGLAWVASRASSEDLFLRWRDGPWTLPLGIGYSVVLRIGVGLVGALIAMTAVAVHLTTPEALRQFVSNNSPDLQTLVDVSALRRNPVYFWLTLTLVSFIVAGLREELWRTALMAGLANLWPQHFTSRKGRIVAVTIAAVLFGCGHLPMGILAVALTGVLGFGLGLIILKHRSIWPAVFAHGMFDATTLALLPFISGKVSALF
jgi:membrane protease YdiL (CAAX protease family)